MKQSNLLFKSACYLLFLTGVLHTLGHFFSLDESSYSVTQLALVTAMKNYYLDNPVKASMWDIMQGYSLSYALFTIFVGALNLMIWRNPSSRKKLLKLNIVMWLIFMIISIMYVIIQPIVMYGLVTILIILSYVFLLKTESHE